MADMSYDAVVIGGGHHATIIANYLQNAGLETGVFERLHEMGGGAAGDELPAPAFLQNPCAHFTRMFGHPAYHDFNLRKFGLHYIFPEGNEAMVFPDETCFVGYSAFRVVDPDTGKEEFSNENFKKTYDEIARFSKRDADMYEWITERYEKKWRIAFRKYRYSPPTPWGVPNPLEELFTDGKYGFDPAWHYMNGVQVARDLFESPELRVLFMRAIATSSGSFPVDAMGVYQVVHMLGLVLSLESASIVSGGTHAITHSLQRSFSSMGGQFFVESEVDKVLLEGDRAVGIKLVNGAEIEARKLVVSDLGVPQTMLRMLRDTELSDRLLHRIKNIDYDRSQIFWGNVALHELPDYKAKSFNPDLGEQPRLYMGPKDEDYMAYNYMSEIFINGFPSPGKMYLLAAADSIWDKNRAPEGKHTILLEEFAAPLRFFSERDWLKMKREIVDHMLKDWQIYAPNMTWDNVIAHNIQTPLDVSYRHPDMKEGGWAEGAMMLSMHDRFRPVPEISNYRIPNVKNMYICSSNLHSCGGIGRGSSYNCFKRIVEDFNLPKIWEEKGREY
jgi:phytoene dehydrogenase-like protein